MSICTLETKIQPNSFVDSLSPTIQAMLGRAVGFLANTRDPGHGMAHVNNLLKAAKRFFKATGDTFEIDKEVLLLALYWHDVWKSQHRPTVRNYLWNELYEGLGSMFMFRRCARAVGLSPRLSRAVAYAIRKHSILQLLPTKTLEAQLLWDVDTLDVWNFQRVQVSFMNLRSKNLAIFDSYIRYMENRGFHFNFEWTKNEVRKLKPRFFEEMSKFRESLLNGNQTLQPLLVPAEAVSGTRYLSSALQNLSSLDDRA